MDVFVICRNLDIISAGHLSGQYLLINGRKTSMVYHNALLKKAVYYPATTTRICRQTLYLVLLQQHLHSLEIVAMFL